MNLRRLFVSLVVAVAAAPMLGQVAMPAASPAGSIPDFSGIWAHLYFPDVEPPPSGPGPVTNLSRRNGISNPTEFVGDYNNPILKPQAAAVVKRYGEMSREGIAYPTPSNQCQPEGVPFVFWNIGMQMLQQPREITILYTGDHEVRHVRMNEQHPAQLVPSWSGDSVGRYQGDALVIDTVGIKVGPFAMVDMYGTPYTGALHVVERYRLLDYAAANEAEARGERGNFHLARVDAGFTDNPDYKGDGLELRFTVEDPGAFTMPWSAGVTYRRPRGDWPEMVCAETTVNYSGRKLALPTADKPDF